MNTGVKLILYLILVIATLITGALFFKNFGKLFEDTPKPNAEALADPQAIANTAPPSVDANAVPDTNAVADTNVVVGVTNSVTDTNATIEAATTNAAPETNAVAAVKPPA